MKWYLAGQINRRKDDHVTTRKPQDMEIRQGRPLKRAERRPVLIPEGHDLAEERARQANLDDASHNHGILRLPNDVVDDDFRAIL